MTGTPHSVRDLLRALPVFPVEMPEFDTTMAPGDPVTLFLDWLEDAIEYKILGPQAMTLSTVGRDGQVTSRVLILKDVDHDGRWYFASSSSSRKGQDLTMHPQAALSFYWSQLGRQVRIRGAVVPMPSSASAVDFLARSPASRAEALTGRQSEPLADPAELDEAFRTAQAQVAADPGLVAPDWTLYGLSADEVEFWQADHERRHVRLHYRRTADGWTSLLLWP